MAFGSPMPSRYTGRYGPRVGEIVLRGLAICLLALCLALFHGLLVGLKPPPEPEDPHAVGLGELAAMPGIIWIDARSEGAFEEGSLSGALHVNEENWERGLSQLLERWEPGRPVIVFCDDSGCGTSRLVAERLREELGLPEVYWFEGGWEKLETGWPAP